MMSEDEFWTPPKLVEAMKNFLIELLQKKLKEEHQYTYKENTNNCKKILTYSSLNFVWNVKILTINRKIMFWWFNCAAHNIRYK